jgi:hypothetical protein
VSLLNVASGENGVQRRNIEIIDSISIYKMSVSVDFVSEGQITHSPTDILGQVVTKKGINYLVVNWRMAIMMSYCQL